MPNFIFNIKDAREAIGAYAPISFMIVLTIALITLIIPIKHAISKDKIYNRLPKQVNPNCIECNSKEITFQYKTSKVYSKSRELINVNLFIIIVALIVDIWFLIDLNSEMPLNTIFDILKGSATIEESHGQFKFSSISNGYLYIIGEYFFIKALAIAKAIAFIINIIFKAFMNKVKKETIVSICHECGQVTEYTRNFKGETTIEE